ncbi:MAG: hypothetical protein KatS3mg105_3957 [Gemmatales bacterium]|nr:MAG: hypothetical protein KatS3mg105_3957 [Gemmatales bacterium]
MRSLWSLTRLGRPQPHTVYYQFEKAGWLVPNEPIPWNAEAVYVEAFFRMPRGTPRRKTDFVLYVPCQEAVVPESMRFLAEEQLTCLQFRVRPPTLSTTAEIHWQHHRVAELTLPVLGREQFIEGLRLQLMSLFVRLGEEQVACKTIVSSECQGLAASAVLSSETSLLPIVDLPLEVEFRSEPGTVKTIPARLTSAQLAERQALVVVGPKRFPRRIGTWTATWLLDGRPLASQHVRAISRRQFQRSLRVTDTRFVVQADDGDVQLVRKPPELHNVARVGPCFIVESRETGMAATCSMRVVASFTDGRPPLVLQEQSVLITDGPTVVAPGIVEARDATKISSFELFLNQQHLGLLPLKPAPTAVFNSEGGFLPPPDFVWSLAYEDELNDRLNKLIENSDKS